MERNGRTDGQQQTKDRKGVVEFSTVTIILFSLSLLLLTPKFEYIRQNSKFYPAYVFWDRDEEGGGSNGRGELVPCWFSVRIDKGEVWSLSNRRMDGRLVIKIRHQGRGDWRNNGDDLKI